MGRIYEKFMRQQARLIRGPAANMPWYSQRSWDDDASNDGDSDGLIGAPLVRTVADIGNGAMSADNALMGFAEKVGVSLLSMGAGQMTAGLDRLASFE